MLSGDPSQARDAKQTDPLSRRSETQWFRNTFNSLEW